MKHSISVVLIILITSLCLPVPLSAQTSTPEPPVASSLLPPIWTPTWTPTALSPETILMVTVSESTNVYEEASTAGNVTATLEVEQFGLIIEDVLDGQKITIGDVASSLWYRVQLSRDREGFIWSGAVEITEFTIVLTDNVVNGLIGLMPVTEEWLDSFLTSIINSEDRDVLDALLSPGDIVEVRAFGCSDGTLLVGSIVLPSGLGEGPYQEYEVVGDWQLEFCGLPVQPVIHP